MLMLIPDTEIDRWLLEDVPFGDLTTHALGIGERLGCMKFQARETLVNRKAEEEYDKFVREIRAEAYIENRLG